MGEVRGIDGSGLRTISDAGVLQIVAVKPDRSDTKYTYIRTSRRHAVVLGGTGRHEDIYR